MKSQPQKQQHRSKSWITRDLTFNAEYGKLVHLKLNWIEQLQDLKTALKNILVCVAMVAKEATLRAKAVKGIKALVKLQPDSLTDPEIVRVLKRQL